MLPYLRAVPEAASSDRDDDLLFDPLLSDEPIDVAAVRADDALIDALAADPDTPVVLLVVEHDPLLLLLIAWAAESRRPE